MMKACNKSFKKWIILITSIFILSSCINTEQDTEYYKQNDQTESIETEDVSQNIYREKVSSIVSDLPSDFSDDDFKSTQVEDTDYYLISWPGSGGPSYCLYNETSDKTVLFNIQSQYPHIYNEDIFENGNTDGYINLIGKLKEEYAYFTDNTQNQLCMLETGERFWTYPWDFPTIITYNVQEDMFSTEKIVLNSDYTKIPGIEHPYLFIGQNSYNLIELKSEFTNNKASMYFGGVEENNNDDLSPAIYYHFDTETNKASILLINVIQKESALIRQNIEKINGISDVIINSPDLSEIDDGFANYIQAYAPNGTTIKEYYDGKTEVPCVYINFFVANNVNLYGQMITEMPQEDKVSIVFYSKEKY